MISFALTTFAPKAAPIDWCPKQTPKIGIEPENCLIASTDIPASLGVQGPGEITK